MKSKGYQTTKGKKDFAYCVANIKKEGGEKNVKLRLSKKDIELLSFLKKYKIMLASESKRIYQSKGYHFKRLKILEKEKYIQRVDRYYIRLDVKGTKLMKEMGYEYYRICRRKDYQDRVKEIVKVATLTLDSNIEFTPSWEIKNNNIVTDTARKFVGELIYQQKKYIAYFISKGKETVYIRQVINDIQKAVGYNNIIVFLEDMKVLSKSNQYFIFGKSSTLIVNCNQKNLDKMRLFQKIDLYEVIKKIYQEEILLSNWKKADYMTEGRQYILLMPFIDTEKLHGINIFYNNNKMSNRKIDIITLKENKGKIEEILTNKVNIIEIEDLLGGIYGEIKKV